MTTPGADEPDETLPLTHRPYGERPPPSGPSGASSPSSPSSPSGEQAGPGWTPYEPPPAPTTPYPQTPGQPYGQQPYGQPAYGHPGYGAALYQPQRAHGGATTAMVLGIICVVSAVLTPFCGVTIFGIVTGPFAIVLGATSMREIGRNPGVYGNHGQAIAGLVTGIIGSLIGLLMVVAVVLFFGLLGVFAGV